MSDPTRPELLVAAAIWRIQYEASLTLDEAATALRDECDSIADPKVTNAEFGRLIDAARALLGSEWKPIDSAPKGKIILLWAVTSVNPPNWKMATGYQANNGDWQWDGEWLKPYQVKPTHWQSLPAPPSSGASDG